MSDPSDAALLRRSRDGEHEAFGALVQRHQGAVCAITFALTGDRTLSEDLAQDAFFAAWRGLAGLRDPKRFRSWVCGIARHVGLNAVRSRSRRREADAALPEPADAMDVEEALNAQQSAALVWSSLERIPPRYREALVLYYREGQSAGEVAAALGISVAAAEQRLSRGRKHLADRVERLVAGSLEQGRPKRGFAAAVVAALPSLEPAAGAAVAASAGATRTVAGLSVASLPLWIAAAAVIVTGAALAIAAGTDAPAAESASEGRGGGPRVEAAAAAADIDGVRRKRERAGEVDARQSAEPPFRLTRLADDDYAVSLAGGASRSMVPPGRDRPPAPIVRRVTGVVLDEQGDPVEGAVVVGDRSLLVASGSLQGSAGDTTGPEGRFSLDVRTEAALSVVALDRRGWSRVHRIDEGTKRAKITLQLGVPSRASGKVTRAGEPTEAQVYVVIEDAGGRLQAFTRSDGEGRWSFPPLPPGTWKVRANTDGGSRTNVPSVELARAAELERDIDLPVGGTVEVIAPLEGVSDGLCLVELYPGKHQVPDAEALAALKRALGKERQHRLVPKHQYAEPIVFEDVPRGGFTACVESMNRPDFAVRSMICGAGSLDQDHAAIELAALAPVDPE